jgi:beta-galactosidase
MFPSPKDLFMSEPTVSPNIIDRQLSLTEPEEISFEDGSSTPLQPVSYTPIPDSEQRILSLDGEWRVCRWPFSREEDELTGPEVNDTEWERVRQPGKVFYADPEAESEPIENWNRVTLDHIDEEDGAVLRRRVCVPESWDGKRVYLRFDAIYPAGRVYLDGELLVEHLSGLTPVEYDVTDRVNAGTEVVVAVRLLRKHRFVKMDMVRHACEFAGLAQSARFFAVEPCRIDDYHLETSLDEGLCHGSIDGTVRLQNDSGAERAGRMIATLSTLDGVQMDSCMLDLMLENGAVEELDLHLGADQPLLWNDEDPNLYRVKLRLEMDAQESQTVSYRTGFRRLELDPDGPKLNGHFIKFRGVNHLTYHPEHGMHTPREWLRKNLRMMKRANVNAIRTHFLGPPALAELCDEMGIYLLQELPIDWGTNYIHDPAWVGPALMRLEGGVRRDRHHPSVMVWCVGNENMPESA